METASFHLRWEGKWVLRGEQHCGEVEGGNEEEQSGVSMMPVV